MILANRFTAALLVSVVVTASISDVVDASFYIQKNYRLITAATE
ncbi:hypothetical protein [Niabella ginsengisoli]|nr:hypothetical protein [Niabella ginsengisoli]